MFVITNLEPNVKIKLGIHFFELGYISSVIDQM